MSLASRPSRGLAMIACSIFLELAAAGCGHRDVVTVYVTRPAPEAVAPAAVAPMASPAPTVSNNPATYSVGDPAAQGMVSATGYGAAGNSTGSPVGPTG